MPPPSPFIASSPAQCHTAAAIAAALGISPQAVRKMLRAASPAGVRIVAGNEAAAWSVNQLPAPLCERLAAEAAQRRCRTIEALLSMPRQQWQPAIPLAKIHDDEIQAATKLRDALKPWLISQHDLNLSAAEIESRGVEDYRRVFGHTITARYWRVLFMRTLRRDGGAEDWQRLEIYLPDRLKQKSAPAAIVSEALAEDFAELESFIAACSNPLAPNPTERAAVWTLALEKFTSLIRSGEPEKSAARRVRLFLSARASFLADGRAALWIAFKRKLAALKNAGGDVNSLRDGRAGNGLEYALPANDYDLLVHRAVFTYLGDIAPAWRDLLHNGFSTAVVERYAGRAQNKSHVPASIMDAVAPEVDILTTMHRGPHAFDSIKGHVTRSYEGIASLQCISGDDFTLNSYFYVPDGNGWFDLTRGQVILFIDFRTSRILGWALEPRKSYSSLTIRSLCTHIFSEFGLPEILYFERGIWKSANLLKGKTDPFTFTEISQGLREFGITFKHAIRPRTKTVERIGGMFQDIAEAEPGYCGRDERRDAPEALRKQMAEVETHKAHPDNYPAVAFVELFSSAAARELENYLRELCLDPATSLQSGPWYFPSLIQTLREYKAQFVSSKSIGAAVTALGERIREVLNYTAYSRGLTLMQGEARLGKSHAARTWAEQHPGQARFVEGPPGNDDISFYRALARGLGLGNFLKYKSAEIRDRVESVLLTSDILLVLDESQRLWPQCNLRYSLPARINWVMTMANKEVPICMISTPQFFTAQKAVEKTGWNSAQLTGRISHYESLPTDLSPEDLMAVAQAVLPEASQQVLRALAVYARSSARYLAAIDSIAKRARYIAMQASRKTATADDVRNAMRESVIPADTKLLRALEAGSKTKPAKMVPAPDNLPLPEEAMETERKEFSLAHPRAGLELPEARRRAGNAAELVAA